MKFKAKSKSPKAGKANAEKTKSPAGGMSLERSWLLGFLGTTAVLAILAYLLFGRISSQVDTAARRQVGAVAAGLAGQISEMVRQRGAVLDHVARDPQLIQLLQSGDQQAIQAKEAALGYLFPGALRVRLLPPGVDTPDLTSKPPLGYACLELLHQAERSKRPPTAEVHSFKTPNQHLALVHAVRTPDGKLVGDVLVTLPVPVLQQAVNRLPKTGGLVELLQPVSGAKPLVLASRGNRRAADTAPDRTLAIAGSRWQLAYWAGPSAGLLTSSSALLFYWGAFGIAAIVMAVLLLVFYRLVARALQGDQVTVIRLVKDMREGALASHYPCRLRNCRGTIAQLQHMAREGGGVAAPTGGGAAAAAPASGDELLGPGLGATDMEIQELDEGAVAAVPAHIFRAYDIRGVVGDSLTADVAFQIGRAIGSEAHERGQQKVIVARDGRLSGPELSTALIKGLVASGREVVDIGRVPTPVLYFATHYVGGGSGVMLTGSHNPPNYNGFKIMLRGETLHDEGIQNLRQRIESGNLTSGEGSVQTLDVLPSYIDRITSDVRLGRPLKVVVDCGNGVTGDLAPQLLRALGCEVVELFCEVDGNFPNHHPDPGKPENLIALTRAVTEHQADVGVAFDGDGDRIGVVDSEGKILWPDRLLMLLAMDVLLRHPGGQIIYDVKCSRHLERVITEHGGQPLMWKTGHSFIKAKMQETGALLAGEMSGHIFFKERWFGFDDGLYAAARLLEILGGDERPSSKVFASLPDSVSTPELNVVLSEGEHFQLMQRLLANARFDGAKLITLDGLRVEFSDGWGLVRASNTTPSLVMRFEADDAAALQRIQEEFRQQLLALDPNLDLPF